MSSRWREFLPGTGCSQLHTGAVLAAGLTAPWTPAWTEAGRKGAARCGDFVGTEGPLGRGTNLLASHRCASRRHQMHTIDRAVRLLDTQTAGFGVFLAGASVAVAVMILIVLALAARLRFVPALLIVGAGLLVGTGVVEATYYSWYKHRCVDHHSDIRECDTGPPRRH